MLNIPNNWKKPFTNLHNERKFMKYELHRETADFKRILAKFDGANIKKIEVIQNINVWERFQTEIKSIKEK